MQAKTLEPPIGRAAARLAAECLRLALNVCCGPWQAKTLKLVMLDQLRAEQQLLRMEGTVQTASAVSRPPPHAGLKLLFDGCWLRMLYVRMKQSNVKLPELCSGFPRDNADAP